MVKQKSASGKKLQPNLYQPEILYPFWAAAVGNLLEAMRRAAEAGETRVPKKHDTWYRYVEQNGFADRLKAEEKAKWEAYSKERELNQQRVLDQIAQSFEQMADSFLITINADFKKIQSLDAKDGSRLMAVKRLTKVFGTMDAVGKFFRMYLRARCQPEKISRNINEQTDIPLGYGELENQPPKAKMPEEAKRIAETIDGKS